MVTVKAMSTHWSGGGGWLFQRLEELLHVFKLLRFQDQAHGWHRRYGRSLVALGEFGIGLGEAFDEISFVFGLRDPVQRRSHGATLAPDHVTIHAGGDRVFPEDVFTAFG